MTTMHHAIEDVVHEDPFDSLDDSALADRFEAMLLHQREATRNEPTAAISLRIPESTLRRLRTRAESAGVPYQPYQTLLKAVVQRFLDDMETATLPHVRLSLDPAAVEQLRTTGLDVVITAR
jgi:predicted DNA binding CopG/RHH family protein